MFLNKYKFISLLSSRQTKYYNVVYLECFAL